MSKLDDLMQQYCPDGVEFFELHTICELQRGEAITIKNMEEGIHPVVAGGQSPSFYCNQFNRDGNIVTIAGSGAYAGFVSYWEEPIMLTDAFSINSKGNISNKFLYFYLKNKQEFIHSMKRGGGVPHVYTSSVSNILIPLPPRQIQDEIIRILDQFTELNEVLNSELFARQKQYEYYRDKLLTFKELES